MKKILSTFYCKLFHIPLPAKEQTAIYAGAFAEFTKGIGRQTPGWYKLSKPRCIGSFCRGSQ